jgi:hypothetical protein
VLGNLTVTNSGGAGFLTVCANGGTQPATSNINMSPGITFANNFTSGVNASNHKISVTWGGAHRFHHRHLRLLPLSPRRYPSQSEGRRRRRPGLDLVAV